MLTILKSLCRLAPLKHRLKQLQLLISSKESGNLNIQRSKKFFSACIFSILLTAAIIMLCRFFFRIRKISAENTYCQNNDVIQIATSTVIICGFFRLKKQMHFCVEFGLEIVALQKNVSNFWRIHCKKKSLKTKISSGSFVLLEFHKKKSFIYLCQFSRIFAFTIEIVTLDKSNVKLQTNCAPYLWFNVIANVI